MANSSETRLQSQIERTEDELKSTFDCNADIVVAAPGRVNLIGEHVDYCGGLVMPMAIDRYIVIAAARAESPNDSVARIRSLQSEQTLTIPLDQPIEPGNPPWGAYVEGVLAGFQKLGVAIPGFDAIIDSSVPTGAGLSSSAALEVAIATLIESLTGRVLDPIDKAKLCQTAEHDFANMPCGLMDQLASVCGRAGEAVLIDCGNNTTTPVSLPPAPVAVLIANTNVHHELSGSEYPVRRQQCEQAADILGVSLLGEATMDQLEQHRDQLDDLIYRRAVHVVSEVARTRAAAAAFAATDLGKISQLFHDSHESLSNDFEVSCPELDTMVAIAREIGTDGGVYATRMTGGGFGGSTVTLIDSNHQDTIIAAMTERYRERTGIEPALFVATPAQGAMVVRG